MIHARPGSRKLAGGSPVVELADFAGLIPASVQKVLARLEAAGYETWLVGGCVRDLALGRAPLDFDLSTRAMPETVMTLFDAVFASGLQHGTVTVLMDRLPIEVTTFRSESTYSDGRRPDRVTFESDIRLDLSRRDFTINSMAYHPQRGLLDPFGGWTDLIARRMRTVGVAHDRFREDALRMLRAIRFTLTYNLVPDPALISAIRDERQSVWRLSIERITHELHRMMRSPHGAGLVQFESCGILAEIAGKLFNLQSDNRILTRMLAEWINPAWHPEQTMPLFNLACRAAAIKTFPELLLSNPARIDQQTKPVIPLAFWRRLLSPKQLDRLDQQFQVDCRLSRYASRQGYGALYAAGLRAHLNVDRAETPEELAILVRLIGRHLAFSPAKARLCAADGWAILTLLLPDQLALHHELINLRQQIQLDQACPGQNYEIPVSLPELAVGGRDLVEWVPLRGPQLGRLLERLLSYVQKEPAHNHADCLKTLAQEWSG